MAYVNGLAAVVQYETATPGTWADMVSVTNLDFSIVNALGQEERVVVGNTPFVEILNFYGGQNLTLNYDGVFENDAVGIKAVDAARTRAHLNLRVFIPGDGFYEADWAISNVNFSRGSAGALKHSAQLVSHGWNPSTGYTADT